MAEFYNFDEALNQLNLREEELKRLVSEGEIRAFRDGDTMKLRRADVENLKSELMGGDLVEMDVETEDLVFEDDLGLDEAGMATEVLSDMDTLLEEDVEDVGEVELDIEEEELAAPAIVSHRGAAAEGEEAAEGAGMRLLAIGTSAVLILAIPIIVSLASGNASDVAKAIAGIFGAEFQ